MQEPYRYEKEVEDFLRWSPSVREREGEFGEHPPRFFPPAPAQARAPARQPAVARALARCRLALLPVVYIWRPSFAGVSMGRSNL